MNNAKSRPPFREEHRTRSTTDAASVVPFQTGAIPSVIGDSRTAQREAHVTNRKLLGHEILRRVSPAEVPPGFLLDPKNERAVLGAPGGSYLVPPGIDVLELGLIARPGRFELLPIALDGRPVWDEVTNLIVTKAQAERQREIVLRSFAALRAMIAEGAYLEVSVTEWSARGETHPVFGMIRLETIETWKALRRGTEPLSEAELERLHAEVARRVAKRIRARIIR
jgi:hypothetical protein